jgi:hypothetical protein
LSKAPLALGTRSVSSCISPQRGSMLFGCRFAALCLCVKKSAGFLLSWFPYSLLIRHWLFVIRHSCMFLLSKNP